MFEFSYSAMRRLVLAGAAAMGLTAAAALVAPVSPALAATTTLYASPSGTGTACSAAQPCSLAAAQTAVRSLNGAMSGDIVVQLADGVYRLVRAAAADRRRLRHQRLHRRYGRRRRRRPSRRSAAPGRSPAGRSPTPGRTSGGPTSAPGSTPGSSTSTAPSPRGRAPRVNRSDFTANSSGLRFTNGALSYLNNLANQNRVQMESVGSFTDRYVSVQSISGNFITMQQPGWSNNNFGYDTFTSPHRAGPLYLANAYEFLDSPGEWYLNPGTGALSYIPLAGQNMSSVSVELPVLQSLVNVGRHLRRARAPHLVHRDHVHRHELAGRPAATRATRTSRPAPTSRATGAGPRFASCHDGCPQFEADPAELVPDARRRAGLRRQQHHLQRLAVRQPGSDGRWASATTPTPTPAVSAWAPATSRSPGPRSPATRPAASWSAACAPTRTTPATSGWSTGTSPSATTASTTSAWSTGASSRS